MLLSQFSHDQLSSTQTSVTTSPVSAQPKSAGNLFQFSSEGFHVPFGIGFPSERGSTSNIHHGRSEGSFRQLTSETSHAPATETPDRRKPNLLTLTPERYRAQC